MLHRAFSLLTVKSVDDAAHVITGIASTPTPDRMGDIVVPTGAKFKTPMPLLLYHQSTKPVGTVDFAKPTKDGIPFRASLPNVFEPGAVKDRVDEAFHSLKYKLIGAVSIGFSALEGGVELLKTGGLKFNAWEWLELSLVSIPAQPDAVIQGFKSLDSERIHQALGLRPVAEDADRAALIESLRAKHTKSIVESDQAALGQQGSPPTDRNRPGASGHAKQAASGRLFHSRSLKGNTMKTLKELRDERATKAARLQELAEIFKADDHEPDEAENGEFDALTEQVKQLDKDIRIASWEATNAAGAKAVDGSSTAAGSRSRSPNVFVKTTDPDDKFKGQSYTRLAISKALAHIAGAGVRPSDIAQQRWGKSNPGLVRWIKANEVPGGGTDSGEWGSELVAMDGRYTGDFIDFLRSTTVFDKLPLREVPANVTIKGRDGTATGYWVGQSKAIPATTVDFMSVNLSPLKVGALAVISKELMADSSPAAEGLVADALRDASAQRIDTTFLSNAAAVAGVSPAGILNGVTAGTSAGSTAQGLRDDILALYASFITAKNANGLYLVTTPSLAKSASLLVNALGQTEFVGLNAGGGMLLGDNVVTGDNVGAGDLILLKPSDIYKIGDSGVEVSASDVAMIEQSTVPTGATDTPVAASQAFTSMFQEDSVAIKVVRRINFAKRRAGVVAYIGDAAYGTGT